MRRSKNHELPARLCIGLAILALALPAVPLAAQDCDSDSSDPVAWWQFDEDSDEAGASGSVVLDSTANDNDGNLYNGASRVPSPFGITAALLDGVNDYVDVGSKSILDNLSAFTYSAWVHPTAFGDREIFSKRNSTKELRFTGTGTLRGCVIASGGAACSDSVGTVPLGTWTHVAMTYDDAGDRKVHLYIDGVEVGYASQSMAGGVLTDEAPNPQLLGRRQNQSRPFAGMLDEMMIFDRALPECRIAELASTTGCDDSDPIAWWQFDEDSDQDGASGSVVLDSTMNDNDGHLYNGASRVPSPFGVTAALLDGVNDYVNVGSKSILDNLQAFTYSAWVYPTAFGDREIFSKRNSTKELRFTGAGTLRGCVIASGGAACSNSVETVPLGTWTHVAMTHDHAGDRKVHLYIDGVEVGYAAQSTASGMMASDAPNPQLLGRRQNKSRPFAGMLDEMMIFDTALPDCRIAALAEPPGGDCPCWAPADLLSVTAGNNFADSSCSTASFPPVQWVIQNTGSTPGVEGGFAVRAGGGGWECFTRDLPPFSLSITEPEAMGCAVQIAARCAAIGDPLP